MANQTESKIGPGKRAAANRRGPDIGTVGAGVLVAAALVGFWQMPLRINHDSALYLQEAEMLLDGAVPYCGFLDINPPLNIYLNCIPAWIARQLGCSPIAVFGLTVIALMLLSTLEIWALLRNRKLGVPRSLRGVVVMLAMALYFVFDWRGDIGQREHLFVLLFLPYAFLRILRYRGGKRGGKRGLAPFVRSTRRAVPAKGACPLFPPTWFALLLGVQAGVGASLKPHFMAAAAAMEIALLWASRSKFCPAGGTYRWRMLFRPECFAAAGFVAVYAAHWLFVPAAMREAFFGRWVPLICRGYRAYDAGYREILLDLFASPVSMVALFGVLCAAATLATRRGPFRLHLAALATLAAAGLAMLLFQKKGWGYHRIPFDAAGWFCLAFYLFSRQHGRRRQRRSRLLVPRPSSRDRWGRHSCLPDKITHNAILVDRNVCPTDHETYHPRPVGALVGAKIGKVTQMSLAAALFAMALLAWFTGRSDYPLSDPPDFYVVRQLIEQETVPGDRVLVVNTSVAPALPFLLRAGRRPGSRYLCSYPLAWIYADAKPRGDEPIYRRGADAPLEERRFLAELREDVERLRPRLIFVHNRAGWQGLPEGFRIYDYLRYCGWAQQALASYREIPGVEHWKVFEYEGAAARKPEHQPAFLDKRVQQ